MCQQLKKILEDLPNQHRKGGQSAPRLGRIVQEKRQLYLKKVVEMAINFYVKNGKSIVTGLIIAGPAEIKNKFRDDKLIQQYFGKEIKMLDTSDIDENTIDEVKKKAADIFCENKQEALIISEIEDLINNNVDLLAFGEEEIFTLLTDGMLKKIVITEKTDTLSQLLEYNKKTEVIEMSDKAFIKKYGGLVGIKWY